MSVYSTLSPDGFVLAGEDLERYSKRKGLCHLCARVETHKRVGKLLKRNQWQPLTVQSESTGDYLVYKGYCIQPTCYTLDQAKENLGEKPMNPRRPLQSSASFISRPSLVFSSTRSGAKASDTLEPRKHEDLSNSKSGEEHSSHLVDDSSMMSFDFLQRAASESLQSKMLMGLLHSVRQSAFGSHLQSSNANNDPASPSQINVSHKWSRDIPMIRLPSLADSNHPDEGKFGGIWRMVSTPNRERVSVQMEYAEKSLEKQKEASPSTSSGGETSVEGSHLRNFLGLSKEKHNCDDQTVVSSFSCCSSSTPSHEEDDESDSAPPQPYDSGGNLPGSGFVSSAAEGNYRAALEALDVAKDTIHGSRADSQNRHRSGDLQALCLQSKQLDRLDIEMVAVEVDAKNRHWLCNVFLLVDDASEEKQQKGNVLFLDSSSNRLVRLSHNRLGEVEELELETDLVCFGKLDVYHGLDDREVGKSRSRSSTGANLPKYCAAAVSSARDRLMSRKDIESRSHLGGLVHLREYNRSRVALDKTFEKGTSRIERLDGADLERRFEQARKENGTLSRMTGDDERWASDMNIDSSRFIDVQDTVSSGELASTTNTWSSKDSSHHPASSDSTNSSLTDVTVKIPRSIGGSQNYQQRGSCGTEVRMTVFQSAPLAYVDRATGTHHVCPLLDFEYEARALTQSLKDAEAAGAKIDDVKFDIATTDRLSAFLAKSESRVMHLSCHGHPNYLALENGFGGMQILPVRDLKRFIAAGAGNLELVFVSACHSKAAGKAFLRAGIRHVICCRQDDKFRDEGAIEFARSFYRALALDNTLKQAFNMAREAMRVSPMVQDSKAEYEKFILLPDLPADSPYHDVHIFTARRTQKVERRVTQEAWKRTTKIIPRTPQFFIGREMDMYTIREALRSNDIIRVQGPRNMGKTSLVAATTRYIEQRHKSFLFDQTFWLPVPEGSVPSDDQVYFDLNKIFDLIRKAEVPCQAEKGYVECWGRVLQQLPDRPLIVVHGECLASSASLKSLQVFLRDLLRISNTKIITVGVPTIDGLPSTVISVEALDFDATVLLFARLSRSVSITGPQIIAALTSLSPCKEEATCRGKVIAWRREELFSAWAPVSQQQ